MREEGIKGTGERDGGGRNRTRKSHTDGRLIAGPMSSTLCVCHNLPNSPLYYIMPGRRPFCTTGNARVSVCYLVLYSDSRSRERNLERIKWPFHRQHLRSTYAATPSLDLSLQEIIAVFCFTNIFTWAFLCTDNLTHSAGVFRFPLFLFLLCNLKHLSVMQGVIPAA